MAQTFTLPSKLSLLANEFMNFEDDPHAQKMFMTKPFIIPLKLSLQMNKIIDFDQDRSVQDMFHCKGMLIHLRLLASSVGPNNPLIPHACRLLSVTVGRGRYNYRSRSVAVGRIPPRLECYTAAATNIIPLYAHNR
eukprot:132884_1